MSFGGGSVPGWHDMLASEADREATQAVLKQAFEDERLNQDEFEARVGKAVSARTQGDLAQLTQDIPRPAPVMPPRRGNTRVWLLVGGAVAVALAAIIGGVVSSTSSSPSRTAAAAPQPVDANPGPPGPGHCPVGTSATALKLANALADDPVYVDPGSGLLTPAQAGQLRAAIIAADAGRIRIAAVSKATLTSGGGERTLANAIASCDADAAGTTVVTTDESTYLVTSYTDNNAASSAVGAALNTHATLAGGLLDAVHRIATVDKASH